MTTKNKQFDCGLAILKMIMSFMVILCHFWDETNANGLLLIFKYTKGCAVPVFMILSFAFAQKLLIKHEKIEIRKRFERLLIPHFGWAIIYWVIYFVIDQIFSTSLQHGIGDLFWQIITGNSLRLNYAMWFQVDLICITALFLLIIVLFKRKYELVLCLLGVISLLVQYTGISMIFESLRDELRYPLGRFAEMIPLAVTGFLLTSKNALEKVKKHRLVSGIGSLAAMALAVLFAQYFDPQGYGYQGIKKILMGVAFVIMFCAIPFDAINDRLKKAILVVSKYTMGIYCVHCLVGTLMNYAISNLDIAVIEQKSFIQCVLIYVLSYLISWGGFKLFEKTKLKSLFA